MLVEDLATVRRQVEDRRAPVRRVGRAGGEPDLLERLHLPGDRRGVQAERGGERAEALRALVGELAHDPVGGPLEVHVAGRGGQVDALHPAQEHRDLLLDLLVGRIHVACPPGAVSGRVG